MQRIIKFVASRLISVYYIPTVLSRLKHTHENRPTRKLDLKKSKYVFKYVTAFYSSEWPIVLPVILPHAHATVSLINFIRPHLVEVKL
jgi:hypothetical protein